LFCGAKLKNIEIDQEAFIHIMDGEGKIGADFRGGSQSVDRALMLLSHVARGDGAANMADLSHASGLARPTIRRLMLALIRAGLVEQDALTRRYALGPEAYVLGVMAQRRFNLLEVAMTSLLALSEESADSSFLSVRRGAYSVCLHRQDGAFPIRTHALQTGDRHPLGVGAGGMAMLAALPDAEVALVRAETENELASNYPAFSPEVLEEGIAQCRARGWALNAGLYLAKSWGIAVALRAPTGDVLGALSIAALDNRMDEARQSRLACLLRREARVVERRLHKRFAAYGGPDEQ